MANLSNLLLLLPFALSSLLIVTSVHHEAQVANKVQVMHPFQSMVYRAQEFSPLIFYGDNQGRLRMEYRPILPKVLYTAGVLGEIMRGVGATVSDILHRAADGFYGPPYGGNFYAPYYPHSLQNPLPQFNRANQQHQGDRGRYNYNEPQETSFDQRQKQLTAAGIAYQVLPSQVLPKYSDPAKAINGSEIAVTSVKNVDKNNMIHIVRKAIAGA